jgi:hypothetical protein
MAAHQRDPARVILALGSTAEHGLLRLFYWQKARIYRRQHMVESQKPWRDKFGLNGPWAKNYAEKKIKWWLENSDWWEIEKNMRRWWVLPILHPNARTGASDYITVLKEIQSFNP